MSITAVATTAMEAAQEVDFPELTVHDRCCRCEKSEINPHGHQAFYRFVTPSGLDLILCKHHGDHNLEAAAAQGLRVIDETHKLNEKPSQSANAD